MVDRLTKSQRNRLMSRIRSKWTEPEREFQAAHPRASRGDFLPFRPDFLLRGRPVFIDSDFWHGWVPEAKYQRMKRFWRDKLFRNVLRDACRDAFYSALASGILVTNVGFHER